MTQCYLNESSQPPEKTWFPFLGNRFADDPIVQMGKPRLRRKESAELGDPEQVACLSPGLSLTPNLCALCGVFKGPLVSSQIRLRKTWERGKIRKGCRRVLEKRAGGGGRGATLCMCVSV